VTGKHSRIDAKSVQKPAETSRKTVHAIEMQASIELQTSGCYYYVAAGKELTQSASGLYLSR
jgi:hypothetical protein